MNWQRKIRTFSNLDITTKKMFPEALVFLLLSIFLLRLVSFKKVSNILGDLNKKQSKYTYRNEDLLKHLEKSISLCAKNIPLKTACYVQALTGKMMLNRRKISNTLYLGIKNDSKGNLKGHAWLICGTYIVTGNINTSSYQVIATYS